jgi:hypothetical protein
MPWKMNGEHIEMKDGNPIWVSDGGSESAVDYAALSTKLTDTTKESVGRKEKIRDLEAQLSVLDGIDDPKDYLAQAKKAIETVKNLDDKQLVDAGKVDEVKAEVTKAMQAKIDEAVKRSDELTATLQKEMIGGRFARSKFIAEKMAIPGDMVEGFFGKHFDIEDGKVVAKGHDGQTIYSRENPGNVADFDEALSILVDGYPNKASILKGSDASGGGAQPGGNGGGGNVKTMSRSEFEKQDPAAQMKFVKDGGKVTD